MVDDDEAVALASQMDLVSWSTGHASGLVTVLGVEEDATDPVAVDNHVDLVE